MAERGLVVRRHGDGTYRERAPRRSPCRPLDADAATPAADADRPAGISRDAGDPLRRAGRSAAEPDDILHGWRSCHDCGGCGLCLGDDRQLDRCGPTWPSTAPSPTPHATRCSAHLVSTLLELLHEHVLISIAGWLPESTDMRRLRHQHAQLFERIVAQDVRGAAATARGHIAFVRRSWQQRLAKEVGPAKARPFDAPLSP
jgi:GntR family transcriptional repressor for pyruvate dehydrogenase complex